MSTNTTVLPTAKTISLYYKEGTSDKEYHVEIVGTETEGYKVNYRFGKRGAKLQCRVKTPTPIDLATATKVFEAMVNAQLKDGYTEGETGTPYQASENEARVSGLLPQLLNFVDESRAQELLSDDEYVMQEKKDGVRIMIRKKKRIIEGINKKGLVVALPLGVVEAVTKACGDADAILDGELVGTKYWLFDMLAIGVHSLSGLGYSARLEAIREWELTDATNDYFQVVPTAVGKSSKKAMFANLKKENAEGVVFKLLSAPYKVGRPASGGTQLKFKFYASATVRVRALNPSKASFQMEMLERGDWTYVGDCTFYPTVYSPKVGHFVEVRYLYAYPGGSLFQPTCLVQRKDVSEDDCLKSQLKYKQGTTEDDEG